MAAKTSLKKFAGVYFTESKTRRWRERPDRVYWLKFRDSDGKNHWERCGWASEGWTPEAAQRRRYELLENDRAGNYKPKRERQRDTLTFGDFMEKHYLPWAGQNKKRSRNDRSFYHNWLAPQFAKKAMKDILPLDLERLKQAMRKAGKAEATTKHALCVLRQAYNKAVAWSLWKGENPCKGVKFPALNNARQRFLSREEADILLAALREKSPQVGRVATLSLFAGMRLGEVLGLTWGNVDAENDIIHVMDGKNNENRPVFITEPIRDVLDELEPGAPDEHLFKTKQDKPVVWLSKTFKKVVDDLGLNKSISDPRQRLTFHTLRHTYASWAVMAGVPLYLVGKAMGHKTTIMTQRYAHLAPESQRQAFEAVAGPPRQAQDQQVKLVVLKEG